MILVAKHVLLVVFVKESSQLPLSSKEQFVTQEFYEL